MLLNNRYAFKTTIGQGGMGKVYLCMDQKENELVAIKECTAHDENAARRIQREYYFMSRLQHPNIVGGVDFFFVENRYFIVMEYINGITLDKFIRAYQKSISIEKQLQIAMQICHAIMQLHKSNIVHRDLKPSNIMLCGKDLTPKILDLGIAKSINKELQTITKIGTIIGTPQYMAPEQMEESGKISEKTDVFSLGTIFYQFFSWQHYSPFYSGNAISTMDKVINFSPPPCPVEVEHIPNVLAGAMEKNVSNRIESVAQLIDKLSVPLVKTTTKTPTANKRHVPIVPEANIQNNDAKKRSNYKNKNTGLTLKYKMLTVAVIVSVVWLFFVMRKPQKPQYNFWERYSLGILAFESQKYNETMTLFESMDQSHPLVAFYMGASLYQNQQQAKKITGVNSKWQRIISYLQVTHQKIPQHLEANYYLANTYRTLGKNKLAKQHFENCIEIAPNNPHFYIELAKVYYTDAKENPDASFSCFANLKKALSLDPGNFEAANLLFYLARLAPHFQGYCLLILEEMFFSLKNIKLPLLFETDARKVKINTHLQYAKGLVKLDERNEKFYLHLAANAYLENESINLSQMRKGIDSFCTVLKDKESGAFLRFLAAYSLGELQQFNLLFSHLEEMAKDTIGKIVIHNILVKHQIAADIQLADFETIMALKDHQHSFLLSLIAQNCCVFSTKYPTPIRTEDNAESVLFKLMASNMPADVRLAAGASAFAFAKVNRDLGHEGFSVLRKFIKDSSATRRQYAHCYLWNNSDGIKEKKAFVDLYIQGLNDSDAKVNMVCLSFFNKYIKKHSVQKIAADLKKLGMRQKTPELSMRALCLWNISPPPAEAVMSLLEENSEILPLAKWMITRFFSICTYMKQDDRMAKYFEALKKIIEYTKRSHDYVFQANMYFLMALHIPQLVVDRDRKYADAQSSLINGLAYSQGLSKQALLSKDNLAAYLYESQPTVRQAANTMMVMLLNDNDKIQFCNSLQNNQDAFVLMGASDGLHRIIQLRSSFMDLNDPVKGQMLMRRVVKPQRYQPFFFEKRYKEHEEFLFTKNYSTVDNLQKISQAKRLYERPVYLYEEALLLIALRQDAKPSLRRAIELAANFYEARVALAEILQQQGDNDKAFELVQDIATKIDNPYTLQKISQLYKKLKKYSHAEITYKKLWDLDPYNKEVLLDIIRIFCLQEKQQQALRYVSWGVQMFKRKYVSTESYDDIIAQSDFAEEEFDFIRSNSYVKGLPE